MTIQPPNEEAIFQIAREIKNPTKRAAYLDQACGGDQDLRKRVDALLDSHESETDFLKSNDRVATTFGPTLRRNDANQQIGPYKIREQIGEGGMGIVYVAEQQSPVRRKVALKVIKPGMDSKEVVARFEAERHALAMMDHPGIAKVFDGGVTETGQPYFAMELINGMPITQYCDEHKLGIRERLDLFIAVCHAVQHAHQKGVIHRDIKPTNVLVTIHDGKPVPVVIDFGVAKATNQNLTDQTIYTRLQQVIGTTLYMSPEQAELSRFGVDTRTDIYSLGVLLYELLAGTTPFDDERFRNAALDEVRRIIREEEPPKPSTRLSTLGNTATKVSSLRRTDPQKLRHSLRGDLDWIVMMALDKDRNRRYETANGLAMDVTRYLNDEPILARPPSTWYRMQKFYSRNRALATSVLFVFVSLAAGLALVSWSLNLAQTERDAKIKLANQLEEQVDREKLAKQSARTERDEKVKLANQLEEQVYRESLRSARNIYYENNVAEVEQILWANRDHPLVKNGEDFNWYSLWKECDNAKRSHPFKMDQTVNRVDCHPTKSLIVVSDWFGQVYLLKLHNNGFKEVWKESRNDDNDLQLGNATRPAFVDNGNFIFFPVFRDSIDENEDQDVLFRFVSTSDLSDKFDLETGIQVSDRDSGNCCTNSSEQIAFANSEGRIHVWKFDSSLKTIDPIGKPVRRDSKVGSLHGGMSFCPTDPSLLMTRHNDAQIFFNQTGNKDRPKEIRPIQFVSSIWDVEWSPDGKKLLTGQFDKNASIIDVESGRVEQTIAGYHQDEIYSVAWSPDGRLLATGGRDGVVRVFDAETRQLIDTLRFHSGMIYTLDFSADWNGDIWLLAGSRSNELWATPVHNLQREILEIDAKVGQFGFSSNGRTIAAVCKVADEADHDETDVNLRFFDATDGKETTTGISNKPYLSVAFSRGSLAAAVSATGQMHLIDLDDKKVMGKADLESSPKPMICFSNDESLLAVIDNEHRARFYTVPDLKETFSEIDLRDSVSCSSISCDNDRLAIARNGGDLIDVFNISTGNLIASYNSGRSDIGWYVIQFSPTDNNTLAAGGWDGKVDVWNHGSSDEPIVIESHKGTLRSLEFSREGSILYSAGSEGTIKSWRMPNFEPMSTFRLYENQNISVYGVVFSKDRSVLAARHRTTSKIHLIRAATPAEVKKSTWWNNKLGQ